MIVYVVFEWKLMCGDILLFVYVHIAVKDPIIKNGRVKITDPVLPRHILLPVPHLDLDFQHMSCCFAGSVF